MAQLGSSSDEWLRSAILSARTFTAAADSFPVPYAKAAFDAVVVLLETVESAKKNRHDLRALCQGSVKIMDILNDQMTMNGEQSQRIYLSSVKSSRVGVRRNIFPCLIWKLLLLSLERTFLPP
ncbi:hypothetical protein C8J57DRAFT_1248545 [Mycena rebaudengoi]|nr:hypothetical protein C8J57DRAFT_1248545 [Mycena rebaudengoi]